VRKLFWVTAAASLVVFCIVQDRVTAEGAREYVALQRAALAGRGRLVTIDEVMQPAIDRSVRLALISSGSVAAVGLAAGLVMRRRTRRTAEEVRYP
jgi:hypothetical protein